MKGFHVSASGVIQGHHGPLVSSPEHEVLRVSCCDSAVSDVHSASSTFCLALQATFSFVMKLGQNVCLDKISDEFKNGSCQVKN